MSSDQKTETDNSQLSSQKESVSEPLGESALSLENDSNIVSVATPSEVAVKQPASSSRVKKESAKIIWATGRRKSAIAQVKMVPSKNDAKIVINGKTVDDYFKGNKKQALSALQSLNAVKGFSGYKLLVKVQGGGITGQAESVRHGIARALSQWEEGFKIQMRKEGFLTRDPRAVERKKPGQPKARKRFQFSKR